MNKKIFCTLGPATLNKKFLSYSQKNIDLLRINMSHINLKNLENTIKYIRKYTTTPICIDTEGAQIRTKIKKKIFLKKNKIFKINFKKGNLLFYPEYINRKLKKNDVLELGFSGLEVKIVKKNSQDLVLKVIKNGLLETNKGVHLKNRKIKIDYLTDKDLQAIKIAKKHRQIIAMLKGYT